jgi:hypothetical protein
MRNGVTSAGTPRARNDKEISGFSEVNQRVFWVKHKSPTADKAQSIRMGFSSNQGTRSYRP